MSKPLKKPRPSFETTLSMIQQEEEKMVTGKIKSKGTKRKASPSHDQSSDNASPKASRTVPSMSTSEIKVNFSFHEYIAGDHCRSEG